MRVELAVDELENVLGKLRFDCEVTEGLLVALELTLGLLVVWVFLAGDLMVIKRGAPSLLLWRLPVAKIACMVVPLVVYKLVVAFLRGLLTFVRQLHPRALVLGLCHVLTERTLDHLHVPSRAPHADHVAVMEFGMMPFWLQFSFLEKI